MSISKNSAWLMEWCDRMLNKFGHPSSGVDWCRKLAYATGEAGNDSPSDEAISMAMRWEEGSCPP